MRELGRENYVGSCILTWKTSPLRYSISRCLNGKNIRLHGPVFWKERYMPDASALRRITVVIHYEFPCAAQSFFWNSWQRKINRIHTPASQREAMASLVFQETHVRALLDLTLLSRGCCCRSVDPHLLCRSRRQDDGLCADGTRGQLLTFMNFNVSGALGRRHTFPWIVCCPECGPIFSAQIRFSVVFFMFFRCTIQTSTAIDCKDGG